MGALCPGRSLSGGGSLSRGVSVQGALSWGSLSRGVSVQEVSIQGGGFCQVDPDAIQLRAGGMQATGMQSCFHAVLGKCLGK